MQPLIDADILLYEVGFGAEIRANTIGGSLEGNARDLLLHKVDEICRYVKADSEPLFYFTGKTNFRNKIAKVRKYKDRPHTKPEAYSYVGNYIRENFKWFLTEGLEADDLLAIEQTKRPDETIICSRDKDLWQVPGWHYSWEVGRQPQRGPTFVDQFGNLALDSNKLSGCGDSLLYAQLLSGDATDTIPGLYGFGPIRTFNSLSSASTRYELFAKALCEYDRFYGEAAFDMMKEQARLVFLIRELDENGNPVFWQPPCRIRSIC